MARRGTSRGNASGSCSVARETVRVGEESAGDEEASVADAAADDCAAAATRVNANGNENEKGSVSGAVGVVRWAAETNG